MERIWANRSVIASGIIPGFEGDPVRVNVFPDAVCPYAKMTALYPSIDADYQLGERLQP